MPRVIVGELTRLRDRARVPRPRQRMLSDDVEREALRTRHRLGPRSPVNHPTLAAGILRQLYAVVVHERAWDPQVAAHGSHRLEVVAA